jgi:hypothetical protein
VFCTDSGAGNTLKELSLYTGGTLDAVSAMMLGSGGKKGLCRVFHTFFANGLRAQCAMPDCFFDGVIVAVPLDLFWYVEHSGYLAAPGTKSIVVLPRNWSKAPQADISRAIVIWVPSILLPERISHRVVP